MIFRNITFQVLIAAIAGYTLANLVGDPGDVADPSGFYELILLLKSVFLSALKMLIAPMIFFSLIGGIASIGNVIRLRSLGAITVTYYLVTTTAAILLALFAVYFIHPWTSYPPLPDIEVSFDASRMITAESGSLVAVLQQMFNLAFTNPVSALVNLNILGIVANAFLIGVAMVLVLEEKSPLFTVVRDINAVIARVLGWVIRIMPIGVFAILYDFTLKISGDGGFGESFLSQLFQFGVLVVILTLVHGLIVLPAIAWMTTRENPLIVLRKISQPMLVAFSTSSSAATLPISMRAADDELRVEKGVSSFVLPLGATMNMDGTALFEAVAAVFLAYLYGIELTNLTIFTIFLMSMVASIGAPGMPSASMAGMQMVLLAVGIPLEAIAILLVIERPLDTVRTAVNVEGDLIGSLVVDRHLARNAGATIPA